jgi:hypothetical protein
MSKNPEYKIEHVKDFLLVPRDRLSQCLIEFRHFLDICHASTDFANSIGDAIGASGPIVKSLDIIKFVWIDDGELNKTVKVITTQEP